MPTLDWIGKKAVLNHHDEIAFRLLRSNTELSVGEPGSGNLLVQGDNLEGLKALLPYYAGQVKCIYIDPPYNTGSDNWVYSDAVDSPEMRAWLGRVVGREAEDLSRHDKWLCMMYPRLCLLKRFLSEDGVIFVSIDDNEVHHLRSMMDEIFGGSNFLCIFAWEKRYGPPPDTKDIGYVHESIVAYRRTPAFRRNLLALTPAQLGRYKNPDNDPRGPWKAMDYTCRYSKDQRPNLYYPIRHPKTGQEVWPKRNRVWGFSPEQHSKNEREERLWWGVTGASRVPAKKNFLSGIQQGFMPTSLIRYQIAGHTHEATKELQQILPAVKFTPKPTRLIVHLLTIGADRSSLIMDSFAGSGTTGHAVLQMNKQDGGNRRFILVELDKEICRNITAERVRRVIGGYSFRDSSGREKTVEGLGGGFRYCELGPSLFDARGQIREEVSFRELAQHVFFSEMGEPLPKPAAAGSPLIGAARGVAVYLLYNGVIRDRSDGGGNVLTRKVLKGLAHHEGAKIVYGAACRLCADTLRSQAITFRQIPYEVRVR